MNKNIVILGLVSLFTDISSEMIYPLVPLYLTGVLGASPAVLGIIEGIAESLASILKIFSGRISDKIGRRKPLTFIGYGLSSVGKLLFILATAWTGILVARVCDRFGKGLRTAPRDALITESAPPEQRGRAFGLHRALDATGAVVGILLAYYLFTHFPGDYILVFWLSFLPASVGVLLIIGVRETGMGTVAPIQKLVFSWSGLDRRLRYYIGISFLFNLGNSSNTFLLLKAGNIGFSAANVILLYLLMKVMQLAVSYPAGNLSDRIGRRRVLVAGYLLYGLVYLGFAVAQGGAAITGLFAVYGIYIGLTEGVEKALLADMAPLDQKATVFGLHALLVGAALLPASVIAGFLWDGFGSAAPFWFGGSLGLLSAAAVWLGLKR